MSPAVDRVAEQRGVEGTNMTEHDRPEPLTIQINGEAVTADLATWRTVRREIDARLQADREAWRAEQRAAGRVWHAVYWQHYSVDEDECFSFDEARGLLVAMSDDGMCGGHAVRLPDGRYVDTDGEPISDLEAQSFEHELGRAEAPPTVYPPTGRLLASGVPVRVVALGGHTVQAGDTFTIKPGAITISAV